MTQLPNHDIPILQFSKLCGDHLKIKTNIFLDSGCVRVKGSTWFVETRSSTILSTCGVTSLTG